MPIQYFDNNGSLNDPVISQSAFNTLDPELGGHPKEFVKFLTSVDEKKITPSLERGDLLHQWIQHKHDFVFADVDKPSEQLADLAEKFHYLYNNKMYELTDGFAEFCQAKLQLEASDYIKLNEICKQINKRSEITSEDVQLLMYCVLYSRRSINMDKRLTDTKVLEKFISTLPYIEFLQKATGKTAITKETKTILINCYESLKQHPIANKLLFDGGNVLYEQEYYWKEAISDFNIQINRKCKIDVVRETEDAIYIIDTKTNAQPVSQFPEGAFKKRKYGRQLKSYEKGYCSATNYDGVKPIHLINVVVQTTEPFTTQVFKMDFATKVAATEDYNKIMKRVAWHIVNQEWSLTREEKEQGFILI